MSEKLTKDQIEHIREEYWKKGHIKALNDIIDVMFGDNLSEKFLRDTYYSNLEWYKEILKLRDQNGR